MATKRKKIIKDKKLRGEWAEMKFMARAAEHGLAVSKPFGESRNYDFVVGSQGQFISVQVKSTTNEFEGGYVCNVGSGDHSYAARAFDFIAAYVVQEDVWYIVPEKKIRGMRCISLFTQSQESKYEPYREAWQLLREAALADEQGSESEAGEEDVSADDTPGPVSLENSRRDILQEHENGVQSAKLEPKPPAANAVERMESAANYVRNFFARKGTKWPRR
jgi:hypothetical protein